MMHREVIIRIKAPSPALERKLIDAVRDEYNIEDVIRQKLKGESYTFLKLESKV